jgi:hypothetical protein
VTRVPAARPAGSSPAGRRVVTPLVAAVVGMALGGCAHGPADAAFGAQPSPSPEIVLLPMPSATAAAPPSGTTATYRQVAGVTLPDPGTTPGATFPDVTTTQLCDVAYSHGVRNPSYDDKARAFALYGVSLRERDQYLADRLIPVSLGGSNAMTNLWPQPYSGGALDKDLLESHLRRLVCTGRVPLAEAQRAIAKDWGAAAKKYLPMVPTDASPSPNARTGPVDPFEVRRGGLCPAAGATGLTVDKAIAFTCQLTSDGTLRWSKRY